MKKRWARGAAALLILFSLLATPTQAADHTFFVTDFATLKTRLSQVGAGHTIRLDADITLEESVTVPAGVTLLIPCKADDEGYQGGKRNYDNPEVTGSASLYRTLTIPEGVTLTVQGTVLVNSVSGRASGGTYEQDITGGYGKIDLAGNIVVQSGGTLDCFGFVTGSGTVVAQSGGTVGDLYVVRNWRGGSQALNLYLMATNPGIAIYPMNEYDCRNIEATLRIDSGATLNALVKMCAAESGKTTAYYFTRFPQINNTNGLVRLTDGAYTLRTIEDGREVFRLYGGASFASSTLEIVGETLSTKSYVYPIDGDISYELHNGAYHFINDYKFLPGAALTVGADAQLTVDAGKTVVFYDEFHDLPNTGSTQYPEREKALLTLADGAVFTNNGTFSGSIKTASPEIRSGASAQWSADTYEAKGYYTSWKDNKLANGFVTLSHTLSIEHNGYDWSFSGNRIVWEPVTTGGVDGVVWTYNPTHGTVRVSGLGVGEHAFVASYDTDGRMLSVGDAAGGAAVPVDSGAATIRLFRVGADGAPRSAAMTIK